MEAGEISYQQTVVTPILSGAGWHGQGMAEATSYSPFVPTYIQIPKGPRDGKAPVAWPIR